MYVAKQEFSENELFAICETAYNNRQRVANTAEILAQWAEDAAAFRQGANADLDLTYLDALAGGSERTKLDIFWPEGANKENCPIALYIHGGYWQAMDKSSSSHVARGVNAHGVALALPSYDLCPDASIGQIADQIAQACLFLWERFRRRLAVGGHSAGGHLTAAMLQRDFTALNPQAPADLVMGGVPLSGLFDLRDLVYTTINDKVKMDLTEAVAWSPLLQPAPKGKVLHSYVGAEESTAFIWQSTAIAEDWAAAGNTTSHTATRRADGKADDHFTIVAHLSDPDSAMTKHLAELAKAAAKRK